jgi:hypothetical protein
MVSAAGASVTAGAHAGSGGQVDVPGGELLVRLPQVHHTHHGGRDEHVVGGHEHLAQCTYILVKGMNIKHNVYTAWRRA